jgi:hypothetical protein
MTPHPNKNIQWLLYILMGSVACLGSMIFYYSMSSDSQTATEVPAVDPLVTELPAVELPATELPVEEAVATEPAMPFSAKTKFDLSYLFNSNCRSGPDKDNYVSLAKIPPGEEVQVLYKDNNQGTWYLVKWEKLSTRCWIDSSLLNYDFDPVLLSSSTEIIAVITESSPQDSGGGSGDGGNGGSGGTSNVTPTKTQPVPATPCPTNAGGQQPPGQCR